MRIKLLKFPEGSPIPSMQSARGRPAPLANPRPEARGTRTCLGSQGSSQALRSGVSAVCVQTPTPASSGTHRHLGWGETPDSGMRDRPMATGRQGIHCFMFSAALG